MLLQQEGLDERPRIFDRTPTQTKNNRFTQIIKTLNDEHIYSEHLTNSKDFLSKLVRTWKTLWS